jgi:hypothetical protein
MLGGNGPAVPRLKASHVMRLAASFDHGLPPPTHPRLCLLQHQHHKKKKKNYTYPYRQSAYHLWEGIYATLGVVPTGVFINTSIQVLLFLRVLAWLAVLSQATEKL